MIILTVKNLSTFADHAAVARVAHLIGGDEYYATHDESGNVVVEITKRGNVYTVTDKESNVNGY